MIFLAIYEDLTGRIQFMESFQISPIFSKLVLILIEINTWNAESAFNKADHDDWYRQLLARIHRQIFSIGLI